MSDQDFKKKAADYTFLQHSKQYTEADDDLQNELFMQDEINAEKRITGKYADLEYKKIAELKMGPPASITKTSKKKAWKKEREAELAQIRKERLEYESKMGDLSEKAINKFLTVAKLNVDEKGLLHEDGFGKAISAGIQHIGVDGKLKYDAFEGAANDEKIKKIISFVNEARLFNDNSDNPEYYSEMIRKFNEFRNEFPEEFFSVSCNDITEEMAKMGGFTQLIIMENVYTVLFNYVDTNKDIEGQLDKENFHKIIAVKNLFNFAIDKMRSTDYYKNMRNDSIKEYKAEKIIKEHKEEDEQAKKEADNKIVEDNLFDEKENGNVDFNINAVDLESVFRNDEKLMPYKELILSYAHEKLGDKFKNDAETKAYLDNMKNNLADYLEAVNNYIKSEAASEIHFNNSTLKDELRKALMNSENYKSRVFTEYKSEKNAALDVVDSVRPQFEKYVKRATIIKEYLKSFGEETVKKVLEKDTLGVFTKETEEKVFSEAVLNAYAKGNENLNIMRSMVEKKISTYTGDDVIKVLQDRYAERIFSASPTSIRVVTDDTIKRLAYMSNSFELGKKEAAFEELCRKAYLPRKYMNYVGSKCKEFNSLEEGGVAKINEVINATLGKIKDNMVAFEKATKDVKLTRNSWSELLTKLEDFSLIDGTAEEVTNKINEFLESHKESGELVVNYNDYIMRNYASDEIKDIKDGKKGELGFYEEKLEGEALKQWGLLTDTLKVEDREIVYKGIKNMLSDGDKLCGYGNLIFLKGMHSIKDLDKLTGEQFAAALEFLKTNFASNIERFASCTCSKEHEVKEALINHLLLDKVSDEAFNNYVETYTQYFVNEEESRKQRLDFAFTRRDKIKERVEYKFLSVQGDKDYIIKQNKRLKPEYRNKRFLYAKKAREAMSELDSGEINRIILGLYSLTENSKEYKKLDKTDADFSADRLEILNKQFHKLEEYAAKYTVKEKSNKFTEADVKALKEYGELGINLETVDKMHKIFEKLKDSKECEGRDKYFAEFMLMEMGPAIFSHVTIPPVTDKKSKHDFNEAENAFLTFDDNKYYDVVYQKGKMVNDRLNYLYSKIVEIAMNKKFNAFGTSALQGSVRERLNKFIYGMEEVPENEDVTKNESALRNKARFGFYTFNEVCNTLKDNAEELIFSREKSENKKRIEAHLDIIDRYKDGIFAPVKEELLDRDYFFNKMVSLDDEGFVKYLDDIYATAGTALIALKNSSFGINMGVNRQFIMTYENEILGNAVLNHKERAVRNDLKFDGNVLNIEQWTAKINAYSDQFFDAKVGGRNSINARIEGITQSKIAKFITGIEKRSDNTWSMLNTYISRNPDALYSLYTSKNATAALQEILTQIEANSDYLAKNGVDHAKEDKKFENKSNMRANFYYVKVCTLTKDEFIAKFSGFDAEFEEEYKKYSSPLVDRKHLSDLSKARVEIDAEKERGVLADSTFTMACTNLKNAKYKSNSLIIGTFGKDKKSQSLEDAKKQVEKAIENYNKERNANFMYDPFIIGLVAEKQASRLAYVNTKEDDKAAEKAIMRTIGFFTLNYSKYKESHPADAKKIMVDAMLHMTDDQFTEGLFVSDLNKSYENKKAKFETLKGRAHDYHPALSYEYNEFVDLAEAAVIQYDEDRFNALINDRIVYYKNATEVYKEIDNWFANTEKGKNYAKEYPENVERLKLGLYDYVHADVLALGKVSERDKDNSKTVTLESIKTKIETVLSDENHYRFLNDSKSVFGTVSYDDLKVNEKSAVKTETRLDMQNYILTQKRSLWDFIVRRTHNPVVKQFAGLNLEQKKMFALALTFPQAVEENNSSIDALRDEYLEKQASDKAIEAIRSYIRGGDFNPEINYVVAYNRLQKEDGSFNDEMFKKAIDFAMAMTARQQANIPKDFRALNAGLRSVERVKPERANELRGLEVDNSNTFVDIISNFAVRDSEIANNFTTKLANLQENKASIASLLKPVKAVQEFFRAENPVTTTREGIALNRLKEIASNEKDMRMLIVILQDRTALDSTTNKSLMSIKDISAVGHVNEKLRAKIIDTFNETNNPNLDDFLAKNVTSDDYKKAMINLFSYQVRDDKKQGEVLEEDDFTSVTAGRNTYIDWTLLERAMSLLDEIKHENDKTLAVRMTREKVMETDNEKAKSQYKDLGLENQDTILDENTFNDTIWANSKEIDNKEHAALMAGFNEMSQMEKVLFFKALQHRDILDISKNNYYASFFGQGDRDYVNKKGRDDLANSFIASSLGTSTSMILDEKDISNAMRTLLSTQIDDTREFDNNTNIKALSVGGRFYEFYEKRSTAIDWKLFRRAIQFVHRTMEERETLIGDREIYRSQGDLRTNGGFVFNSSLMRKNLHSTGSRIARFLAKKGTEQTLAHIPGASAIQMGIATMLSDETKNAISGYKQFGKEAAKEEEDGMFWKIKGYVDAGNGYAGTILGMNEYGKYASYVGLDYEKDLHGDVIDKVSEIGTYISDGIKVVSDALDKAKDIKEDMDNKAVVEDAFKKAAFYKEEDRKKAEEAKANQSELQRERAEKALKNNRFITGEITKNLVDSTLNAKIAGEVIDFIGDTIQVGSLQGLVLTEEQQKGTLVGEIENIVGLAKDTILFIMQALKEKKMLDTYFGNDTEFGKAVIKTKNDGMASGNLTDAQKTNMKDMSNRTFAENSHGFEGFTEQSTFVGMKITHSVLFAASSQNPVIENRIKAIAMLTALGLKQYVGRQDSEAHEKLFSAFMGEEYR